MKYQKGQLVKNLATGGFHLVAGYVANPLDINSGEVIVYTGTKESLKLHFLPVNRCELIGNNYRSRNEKLRTH